MLRWASDLDFGTTYIKKNGHEIWNMECSESVYGRFTENSSIVMRVVLCGCETWSLTLREEHELKVFDSRVLRRIYGPEREEVASSLVRFTRSNQGG
jgi:hypothetical protein